MNRADPLVISRVRAVAVRAAITTPVRTSFGVMTDRPAVFVEVADDAGRRGFGEVWCNFPSVGAEHRARLTNEVVGPVLRRLSPLPVGEVFARLMASMHVLALQSGEWGPLRQVAAGLDMACHDLAARRADVPLYSYLGGTRTKVRAYASGIGPEDPAGVAARERDRGHDAFKLKVGFGETLDRRSLDAMRRSLGADATVMIDANQGWTCEEAILHGQALSAYGVGWLEEPVAADRPRDEWRAVAEAVPIPLAAGENINAAEDFAAAIEEGSLKVVQPDAAKWGGVSGCLAVAAQARGAGLTYCPHYLGGAVGLVASAHLLAAAGGDGLLEIDTNPNPWRDRWAGDRLTLEDGHVRLSDRAGLGIDLDRDALFG